VVTVDLEIGGTVATWLLLRSADTSCISLLFLYVLVLSGFTWLQWYLAVVFTWLLFLTGCSVGLAVVPHLFCHRVGWHLTAATTVLGVGYHCHLASVTTLYLAMMVAAWLASNATWLLLLRGCYCSLVAVATWLP
jgi:hypothetical protein